MQASTGIAAAHGYATAAACSYCATGNDHAGMAPRTATPTSTAMLPPPTAGGNVAKPPKTACTNSGATISATISNATAQMTMGVNGECRAKWTDPSTTVSLAKAPGHGSVSFEGQSGYVYKPNTGYSGSDSFVIAVQYLGKNSGKQIKGNVTYRVTVK